MYSFKLCYYFKFIRVKSFTKFVSICYPVCFTVFQCSTTQSNNLNLDFNVVRDIAPSVPTTLATPQKGGKKVYKNNYRNTI